MTTSRCPKPSASARTTRSTPGWTSAYVAVLPSIFGAGSTPSGHVSDISRPARRRVTNGSSFAPPAKDRSTVAAFGPHRPSSRFTRASSISIHLPARIMRTGSVYSLA
ncbi:hypothetical protein AB0H18_44845 [Streptomyces sp. NPDC020766]|uniref:hypothetical protein n=1 Tax=Streptomyces sp. NPDC020766 TaxID=3155011 RepID=UPI0033CF657C